jgi:hypothetical protein
VRSGHIHNGITSARGRGPDEEAPLGALHFITLYSASMA